jgi:uncharacterized protein (DUF1499 family)
MGKTFGVLAVLIFIALPVIIWIFGQLNFFAGRRPEDLGPRDGQLRPPLKGRRNVVSSQADLHEHEAHHLIAPLAYTGTGQAAMEKLLRVLHGMNGVTVVSVEPHYIHAEFKSLLLNMVDDAEFLLDESASVIHMRSGSRLNRKDFGANRARLETVRARFNTSV